MLKFFNYALKLKVEYSHNYSYGLLQVVVLLEYDSQPDCFNRIFDCSIRVY